MRRFVGRVVEVETTDGAPIAVVRGGRHVVVERVAEVGCPDFRPDWRLRRHHRRFLVRADGGLVMDLHQERRQGKWTLYAVDDQGWAGPFRRSPGPI